MYKRQVAVLSAAALPHPLEGVYDNEADTWVIHEEALQHRQQVSPTQVGFKFQMEASHWVLHTEHPDQPALDALPRVLQRQIQHLGAVGGLSQEGGPCSQDVYKRQV